MKIQTFSLLTAPRIIINLNVHIKDSTTNSS